MGGDIDGARTEFRQAISVLQAQQRQEEAAALKAQISGLVKLDETPGA